MYVPIKSFVAHCLTAVASLHATNEQKTLFVEEDREHWIMPTGDRLPSDLSSMQSGAKELLPA